MANKAIGDWFFTDDFQICRKFDKTSYEFIEFNQVDDLMISSSDIIDVRQYKDENGEWDKETLDIISTYYSDLEELRRNVGVDDEDQIVAEYIFEQISQFDYNSKQMTEDEASQYLQDIVEGKITI